MFREQISTGTKSSCQQCSLDWKLCEVYILRSAKLHLIMQSSSAVISELPVSFLGWAGNGEVKVVECVMSMFGSMLMVLRKQ